MLRRLCILVLVFLFPALVRASVQFTAEQAAGQKRALLERERRLWSSAVHDSEYAAMPRTASRNACGAAQPPQALTTPDPLLEDTDLSSKVSVSFIIGTDGRVHSALIMESAGPNEDQTVLDAVRSWRYRPALCNGVPTEAEAKIEFSNR